jgi:SagB-type dehydrogenase family enzyme
VTSDASLAAVYRYHDGTKHNFNAFARSLGYLDWASQPRPFRTYADAPAFALYPAPDAPGEAYIQNHSTFDRLPDSSAARVSAAAVGDFLRHALGLSAWKRFGNARWSLRVNPSSGNLHPTEAYVICGELLGLAAEPAVYHYAPDRHALERRCTFDAAAWQEVSGGRDDVLLVALTSIHWREAWKYAERAFRYCQHDVGHAIGAISFSASVLGWRAALLPAWSHHALVAATGVGRNADFFEAEREDPACMIAITDGDPLACSEDDSARLAGAISRGRWSGRASQLSEDHVVWTLIDDVAAATQGSGRPSPRLSTAANDVSAAPIRADRGVDARALLLQRRSALAFDGRTAIDRSTFLSMLSRTLPGAAPPLRSLWWPPHVHLAIFVHRVDGVAPGIYMLVRDADASERLRASFRPEFLWDRADEQLPLVRLSNGDARALAARLSCDQDIAADGFFSLAMVADFDAGLREFGPSFYRQLFWETGAIGQVLYLEAEAAGARATGIGCFYDDPVHDVLGIREHAFQSLYHFTVGRHVDDPRLTTEPGYSWPASA